MTLPDSFYDGLLINSKVLEPYLLEHTDLFTDALFSFPTIKTVIADLSRFYCDVERFKDDDKEPMSKVGQGVIYTHLYDGTPFHKHNQSYQDEVTAYYDAHHQKLNDYVNQCQKNQEELLIIDAHSFSERLANHFFVGDYPDIDLGINDDFKHPEILEMTKKVITEHGYSVKINYPFAGTIIPSDAYKYHDKEVYAMMIEINKRTYLKDNHEIDMEKYKKLRNVLKIIIDTIKAY